MVTVQLVVQLLVPPVAVAIAATGHIHIHRHLTPPTETAAAGSVLKAVEEVVPGERESLVGQKPVHL